MSAVTSQSAPVEAASIGGMLRAWRHARRISQLDLALSADVSQKHLSFVESGRANPSRDMVLRLAESLGIPLREQNALLTVAGFTPHYLERGLDDDAMAPVRHALEITLEHHEPYPAMVVNRNWEMLLANGAMYRLLGRLPGFQVPPPGEPVNTLHIVFDDNALKPYIENWDEVALNMLQRLQREAVATGSPVLEALLAGLREQHALPSGWYDLDWTQPPPPVLPVIFALAGARIRLFSMIATFGTPMDLTTDELRLETFFPMDSETEAFLRANTD